MRHLAQELPISDNAALGGLVRLVDDGDLVRILQSMAINAIKGGIEKAPYEPGIVAVREGTEMSSMEVFVEGEELTG